MLIGQDFEKLQLPVGNLILLEPNVLFTDTIMAGISLGLGIMLLRKPTKFAAHRWWTAFFLLFGISSFLGGLGHAMFGYWGIYGKFGSWLTAIPAIYFIERGMVDQEPNEQLKKRYQTIALIKMFLVTVIFGFVCWKGNLEVKPERGFLPIAAHTIIGVSMSAGYLGWRYSKQLHRSFYDYYLGMLIILPSAFFFLLKINPVVWFDKNDVSHVFITIGIVYFYKAIRGYDFGKV